MIGYAVLNTISGDAIHVSEGSIYSFCKKFADKAQSSLEQIKEELINSNILNTDAIVITVNGKQEYIRNQSTATAVLYNAMEKNVLQQRSDLQKMR